jgi:thiamine kinase-like enzyme
VVIDPSPKLHPEVEADYHRLIKDETTPQHFKDLAQKAKDILDTTLDETIFQFLHNDAHPENIIIKDKQISGIIDFGNAEYGEIAKEFSRYIRDFPHHFTHIVSAYENASCNKLSHRRLVSNALLSGFIDIVESYHKGGEEKAKAEKVISIYKDLLA